MEAVLGIDRDAFKRIEGFVAVYHLAKHGVHVVQMVMGAIGDEELRGWWWVVVMWVTQQTIMR